MRESFIFHKDYISDLPDGYRKDFAIYAINYALNGELPSLVHGTLEYALWAKIARRIDAESEKYKEISEKRREAAQRRYTGRQAKIETPTKKNANTDTSEQEEQKQTARKSKDARFEKPTIEEIAEYCEERKNNVNAQTFFDFYEAKGWKIGAAKMKDWKASVRTWEQRRKTEQTGGRQKAGTIWEKENEIPQDVVNMF